MENGSVMIGQIAGMVKNIKSCEEIINEIIEDAKSQLSLMKEFV